MKAGWEILELGQLATVGAGNSAPQDETLFVDGRTPFFRTSDIGRVRFGDIETATDLLNESGTQGLRMFPAGTILFPKSGASTFLNHRVMMQVDGCVSSHLATITANPAIAEPRFLLYFLATVQAQDMVQDHAYPSLNLPLIAGIKVPTPNIEEQRRIVTLLDEAFADIATAKANAEKNLQNARDFFYGQLQAIFASGSNSWSSSTLGQTYDVRDGTHDSPKYQAEGYPLITSKNLKREGLSFDDVKLIAELDYAKINERSAVHQGDVLLAMIGTIGNPTVVEIEPNFAIKNVALLKVPKTQNSYFLQYYLSTPSVIAKMQSEAKGTTQKFVGLGYLRAFPISIPALGKQQMIVEKLDELRTESDRLESIYRQKLTALDDLKKSLLHQAFSGQL